MGDSAGSSAGYVRFRLALILATALALTAPAAACAAAPAVGFGAPAYLDDQLAGGEPLLWQDPIHHTLPYTSHQGTTHLYPARLQSPPRRFQFISNHRTHAIL